MKTRCFASLLTILVVLLPALPAAAQSDTGEIDIAVQNAQTKAPIALARVLLDGPVITSEFSGANGKVRFTEVPDGIYRARVFARGYDGVTSADFEVTNGRLVTVTVGLAQNSGLKTIASVVSKSSAVVSTTMLDENSAQRKLSGNLADALGKLSGVSVATSSGDSDATTTVSLSGQDASQTSLTLDGIPLNAPGTAGDLGAIGTDLFTRSSVSFGPQIGGLAGGVNFSTLQPTLSWQSAFSLAAGSNGKNNYSFGESGSVGKLGLAVMHTYRMMPSLLDGMRFLDQSGLDYSHQGDRQQKGTLVNLRYELDQAQTLSGMLLDSTGGSEIVCTQQTGALPCGYGPGNFYGTHFKLYSISDNALIGDTVVGASLYGTDMASTRNLLDRYIDGIAAPTGTSQAFDSRGFTLNATLPAKQRHTISVSAYGTSSSARFSPLVPQAAPYVYPGQRTSYAAITLNDAVRSSAQLRLLGSIGLSTGSNAGLSTLVSAAAAWTPDTADTFSASYGIGGAAPRAGRFGVLSDPAQLRYDCTGSVAYGNAPGAEPGQSSSVSANLSYTRRSKAGMTSVSLYRQVQNGIVLPTQVNGTVLGSVSPFPAGYFNTIGAAFGRTCGNAVPFGPQDVYFSTPVGGTQRVYQGARIGGFYQLGNLVVEPYYDVQSAVAGGGGFLLDNPYSITLAGAQLPNVPLHRAGITLDYKAPHAAVEWLADANYTGANNQQNLPANTVVDAGVDVALSRGSLVLAMTNVFDAYGGIFAGPQWAVPYTTPNGTQIATIARPNQPRQIAVTYDLRFGRQVTPAPQRALVGGGQRRGGFRRFFQPLPSAPPSDPFALSGGPRCTSDARTLAAPVLAALKSDVAAIEAAKMTGGYPQALALAPIPGVAVTYRGMGSTYALSIAIDRFDLLRALFGCSQFHFTDLQTATARKLYVQPQQGGFFFQPVVTFMPSVGLYFVRRPPQAGQQSFRLYQLPAAPPKDPFALGSAGGACSAQAHGEAARDLAALRVHFTSGGVASGWTIVAHTAPSGTWYELRSQAISAIPALLSCGHVAATTEAALKAKGWDGAPVPALNYAPPLGIYMMRPQRPRAAATPPPASR